MAPREDRLPSATRSYVIFGLIFVIAGALALRAWLNPSTTRGERDTWLSVVIVTEDSAVFGERLADVDGLLATQLPRATIVAAGRELLDDPEASELDAAMAYADQHGSGFVVFDLDEDGEGPAWVEDAPATARFVAVSVGDRRSEGLRFHYGELATGVEFDPLIASFDSLRLALLGHPDFERLWTEDDNSPSAHQARQILDSRQVRGRLEQLRSDHRLWSQSRERWPELPGALARPWEQVRATPVRGGLLLEIQPARLVVGRSRRLRVELEERASLRFLPASAVRASELVTARARCEGLPEAPAKLVSVARDGRSLILRREPASPAELFVFDAPSEARPCRVSALGEIEGLGFGAIARSTSGGRAAWMLRDDWLRWSDALGEHSEQVHALDDYSGPWWVDGELIAMIAERPLPLPALGFERVLSLLATEPLPDREPGEARARLELSTAVLLPERASERAVAPLLDLRPAGIDTLLLISEACPELPSAPGPDAASQPCLLRLRSAAPLGSLVREWAEAEHPAPTAELDEDDPEALATLAAERAAAVRERLAGRLELDVLGPIGPYRSWTLAADGSRVAWIDTGVDHEPRLVAAAITDAGLGPLTRVDDDPRPESRPRMSSDGALIVTQAEVGAEDLSEAGLLDTLTVARVFTLDER